MRNWPVGVKGVANGLVMQFMVLICRHVEVLTSLFLLNPSALACEVVRTNELCEKYSNACVDLCKEMDVKVVDLYNAIRRRKGWSNACFT